MKKKEQTSVDPKLKQAMVNGMYLTEIIRKKLSKKTSKNKKEKS